MAIKNYMYPVKKVNEEEREAIMARVCEISKELSRAFDSSPNRVMGALSGSRIAKLFKELRFLNKKLGLV